MTISKLVSVHVHVHVLVLVLVLVLLAACTVAPPPETPVPAPAPAPTLARPAPPLDAAVAPPPESLRAIDWCNRTYGDLGPSLFDCRGERDERHSEHGGIWAFEHFHLTSVAYGDLTGDGVEDALLILEVSVEPVIIQKTRAPVRGEMWVISEQGDALVGYTTESSDTPPTRASIADGVATVAWVEHGTSCTERWRFGKVGEAAVKSPRQCRR